MKVVMEDDVLHANGHRCLHGDVWMYEGIVSYPVGKEYERVLIDGVLYERVDMSRRYATPEDNMTKTVR